MFRKVLVAGGMLLLAVSAPLARAQEGAPVPTTPTTSAFGVTTSTTQPPTTVERSGVASTGPHDYVGWLSLAGVVSVALGISLRGRRANGAHFG